MAKKREHRKASKSSRKARRAPKRRHATHEPTLQALIKEDTREKSSFEHGIYLHNNAFVIASIVGFVISAFYVYPMSKPFGFAFGLVFVVMFASSVLSMTFAPLNTPDHALQIDYKRRP